MDGARARRDISPDSPTAISGSDRNARAYCVNENNKQTKKKIIIISFLTPRLNKYMKVNFTHIQFIADLINTY